MNEKEKELLDYLYTVGQQIQDYMHRNGHDEKGVFYIADLSVIISLSGKKHDNVYAHVSSTSDGTNWRTVKREFDAFEGRSKYEEREWKK